MDNNKKHNPDNAQNQEAREGNYKNVQTSVNNPSSFDNRYQSKQEDKIADEEAKTEKEGRTGKS